MTNPDNLCPACLEAASRGVVQSCENCGTPPPAGEMFRSDGRPRCRTFRYGVQCLGAADEGHEHHNPASLPEQVALDENELGVSHAG